MMCIWRSVPAHAISVLYKYIIVLSFYFHVTQSRRCAPIAVPAFGLEDQPTSFYTLSSLEDIGIESGAGVC